MVKFADCYCPAANQPKTAYPSCNRTLSPDTRHNASSPESLQKALSKPFKADSGKNDHPTRNRMYSPEMKRFISMDPLGFADSMNLYETFGCDPVNKVDPYGLRETSIYPEEAKTLLNIAPIINKMVQEVINEAYKQEYGKRKDPVVNYVYRKLAGYFISEAITTIELKLQLMNPMDYLDDVANNGKVTRDKYLLSKSIDKTLYAGAAQEYPDLLGNMTDLAIAPGVNIDGHAIGIDKIGHFFNEGMTYYTMERKSGIEKTEEHFDLMEKTRHGMGKPLVITTPLGSAVIESPGGVSGVYSYADLEANRQGGRFYKELSEHYENWKKTKTGPVFQFDISKYVSDKWDENVNMNDYIPEMRNIVERNLLKR